MGEDDKGVGDRMRNVLNQMSYMSQTRDGGGKQDMLVPYPIPQAEYMEELDFNATGGWSELTSVATGSAFLTGSVIGAGIGIRDVAPFLGVFPGIKTKAAYLFSGISKTIPRYSNKFGCVVLSIQLLERPLYFIRGESDLYNYIPSATVMGAYFARQFAKTQRMTIIGASTGFGIFTAGLLVHKFLNINFAEIKNPFTGLKEKFDEFRSSDEGDGRDTEQFIDESKPIRKDDQFFNDESPVD